MNSAKQRFLAGDLVEVKSLSEIGQTLDENGTEGGLPFMPEMMRYCGQQFHVARRAGKTCIEPEPGSFQVRAFERDDLCTLEELRCGGEAHDGCQRRCLLFWSSKWLRKADVRPGTARFAPRDSTPLNLKTKIAPNRYFCQSTELLKLCVPLTKKRIIARCVDDVRSGSRRLSEMARLVFFPAWRKLTARLPRQKLVGTLTKTPVGNLNLQPGEWVEIRTAAQIAETLDTKGRTRGLTCDFGMANFRGPSYQVAGRLDRMISEPTGEMKKVESTVILNGLECTCINVVGGCPRREPIYWREVWLERAQEGRRKSS